MAKRQRKYIFLYVLRLEGDKYYVGQSRNLTERLKKHFEGRGSSWTRLHRPLEVVSTVELGTTSWVTAMRAETYLTLDLMKIYGTDNVRGGAYTACILPSAPITCSYE